MENYSAFKNETMSFAATWMDLEIATLSEVREGELLYDIFYMWNLKWNDTNEFAYKTETDAENEFMVAGEKDGREGLVRVFGMVMYILLYLKWVTKDLLYSTWNPTECYVTAWMEGEFGENEYTCMYGWIPSLFTWNSHIVNWLCMLLLLSSVQLFVTPWTV